MGLFTAAKRALLKSSHRRNSANVKELRNKEEDKQPKTKTKSSKEHGHRKKRAQTARVAPPQPRTAWHSSSRGRSRTLSPITEEDENAEESTHTRSAPSLLPTSTPGRLVVRTPHTYIRRYGFAGVGNGQRATKTQIFIDLRNLTHVFSADPDNDASYSKENGAEVQSSGTNGTNESIGLIVAHQPMSVRPKQPAHWSPANHAVKASSAMEALDNIIRSEVKLDKPYLTKENVDTSIPGSTTLADAAPTRSEQFPLLQPTPSDPNGKQTQLDNKEKDSCSNPTANTGTDEQSKEQKEVSNQSTATVPSEIVRSPNPEIPLTTGAKTQENTEPTSTGNQAGANNENPTKIGETGGVNKATASGEGTDKESNYHEEKSETSRNIVSASSGNDDNGVKPDIERQPSPSKQKPYCASLSRPYFSSSFNRVNLGYKLLLKGDAVKKNFHHFSCHDQKLRAAGYNVSEVERKIKVLRLKAGVKKRKRCITCNQTGAHHSPRDDTKARSLSTQSRNSLRKIQILSSFLYRSKIKQLQGKGEVDKTGVDIAKKMKPLLEYFSLVLANPVEYNIMQDSSKHREISSQHPSQCRLVDLGKAFGNYQEQLKSPLTFTEQVVADLEIQQKHSYHHVLLQHQPKQCEAIDSLKQKLDVDTSEQKESKESTVENQPLVQLQQARRNVDTWLTTLTTHEYLKAKELLLRIYGVDSRHDDQCRYIRTRSVYGDDG